MEENSVKQTLSLCPLFDSLSDSELDELVAISRVKPIFKGQCVFDIDDPSEELYILLAGHVCFQHHSANGKKVTLGIAETPMVIGDMELFDPTPRQSRALVLKDGNIATIPKPGFLSMCRRNPSIYEKLLKIYSRRLQQAARAMLLKDDTQLLCSVLLNFSQRFGKKIDDGIEIQLNLSQEELASYVGAPRQRLNRMLGEFKSQGWIQTRYNKITILNASAMAHFLDPFQ